MIHTHTYTMVKRSPQSSQLTCLSPYIVPFNFPFLLCPVFTTPHVKPTRFAPPSAEGVQASVFACPILSAGMPFSVLLSTSEQSTLDKSAQIITFSFKPSLTPQAVLCPLRHHCTLCTSQHNTSHSAIIICYLCLSSIRLRAPWGQRLGFCVSGFKKCILSK